MSEILPASVYQFVYLLIISIITLFVYQRYGAMNGSIRYQHGQKEIACFLLALFMILFIGLRPQSGVFIDMMNYVQYYHVFFEGTTFCFNANTDNLIFDNLFAWWGAERLGIQFFFLFIATIYFGCSYLGIKRLFPRHKLAAYVVFLGAFSTFTYGTNGIKAGAAASLFIWALGYRDNLKICIPLILLSMGFHHSMQLPVAAFILTLFFKNPKLYFYGWLFCLICALAHITFFQTLFAGYTDEQGASYLMASPDGVEVYGGQGGFRIDFILYSAIPVFIGYYTIMKKKIQVSKLYIELIDLYLCINGVWMLCMYASFTNRIAYLSWSLYPIVLIYPFLNENWGENKYQLFGQIMIIHLCFTLFMEMIYYGGLAKLLL